MQRDSRPHARDDSGKAEAAEKKLTRLTERAERADDGAKQALDQITRLSARMNSRAGGRVPAEGSLALQTQLKQAQQRQLDAEKASKRAEKAYEETVRLARKADQEKGDAERASAAAAASYRSIRSGFISTRQKLRELESELAG